MSEEQVKKIVEGYKIRLTPGSIFDFIEFKDNTLKIKFVCSDKTEFKVQGKKVTMEDEMKKQIEKYLKAKINNVNVIFI